MTRIAKEWEEVDALAGQEKNRLGKINLERQRVAKLEVGPLRSALCRLHGYL